MSRRKHIPEDKLPPKPKACSRVVLPAHQSYTKECLRIARDRAERALQEIVRIRTQLPLVDEKILLFSDNEQRSDSYSLVSGKFITTVQGTNHHEITLAELNTLLAELTCVLEQAYLNKEPTKGEKQKHKPTKNRTSHRGIKNTRSSSISFPFNDVHLPHHHRHPRLAKNEPAAQLIRRNELLEVEKG